MIYSAVEETLGPTSLIDVGCAIGDLVDVFLFHGVDAYGLEGTDNVAPWSLIPPARMHYHDLRMPIDLDRTFDLVTCFEVLEHIEPECSDMLLKNLTGMSNKLLVSAAPPGQGGHYHVNCQPIEYWDEKLASLGYEPDLNIVKEIQNKLAPWRKKPGILAIYQNLAYYEKPSI